MLRIALFSEMAVSGNDSLDPGPEPLAGLRHGVPAKGTHHRLHLLDLDHNFFVRLCIDL
jgi:hypothetical protein